MRSFLTCAFGAAVAILSFGNAQAAYVTYFGKDLNGSSIVALNSMPKSSAAQAQFLSGLSNPQFETFEGIAAGTKNPTLNFGSKVAQLSGGNSSVVAVTPGRTDNTGRYSVPAGSSKFYNVEANLINRDFSVKFNEEVGAFGFFGIDIGDVGGSLYLDFYNDLSQLIQTIAVPNIPGEANNGSVLYLGVIASSADEYFKTVTFRNLNGSGDGFGFDNFTVADPSRVSTVPEPGTVALFGLGLAGVIASRKRKA